MTTEDNATSDSAGEQVGPEKMRKLEENLARIEGLTQRLIAAFAHKRSVDPALNGPAPELFLKAATQAWAESMVNPMRMMEQQIAYWGKTLRHYADAQQALAAGQFRAPAPSGAENPDRRFANPLWQTHPFFNFVKQQYLINAEALETAVAALDGLDAEERGRVEYFARQMIDMMAPTNFLGTNPDALERAVETDGESLVRGMENLVADIEANTGELLVTLADKRAFRVGENLATTPGTVVFRNHLIELIQYAPSTETVHQVPLILFPPWINKFYVLDLKPANSLIKWIVDQGFTLFVVSWVNPDASYAGTGMDDYIRDGYLAAIAAVRDLTGVPQVNAVGYCIAGTTLSLTLAYLAKTGDKSVRSASLFTTMTDFSDPGEVGVFLKDDFLDGLERQTAQDGVLDRFFMGRTFSFLRSNDLIWQPAIRSYMLGDAPPAFDLLFWNGDGTNLPARMAMEYLRGLCQRDEFSTIGFPVLGTRVHPRDITLPVCSVACETDHIAHWRGCFNGFARFGSRDKTFILSQSGHVAGIVNPPSRGKYGHYTSTAPLRGLPDDWRAGAQFDPASWWSTWAGWLARRSGKQVSARIPGDSGRPTYGAAPGSYVCANASP